MAIVTMTLDPNAAFISSTDELAEGTINKYDTGVPLLGAGATLEELPDGANRVATNPTDVARLSGVEANAKDDQDGAEVRDLIVALEDLDRKILITDPIAGEFKVIGAVVNADDKLDVKHNDVAEV